MSSNRKTVVCKNYIAGKCRFGSRCNFAHGEKDLSNKKAPCWFFNNGGCIRTAQECVCEHVKAQVRKPLIVQKPCLYQHTQKGCKRRETCKFDHFELNQTEWKHHYPQIRFPGKGYLDVAKSSKDKSSKNEDKRESPENIWTVLVNLEEKPKEESLDKMDEFPKLPSKNTTNLGCWNKIPDSVKQEAEIQQQQQEESPIEEKKLTILKRAKALESFEPPELEEPTLKDGESWYDFMRREEEWEKTTGKVSIYATVTV